MFDFACHQYSVYGTTVAVVPPMIRAARMLPPGHDNRYELLSLAGLLVLLVGDRSSDLGGPSLGEAFVAAVKSAAPLVAESLRGVWPEDRFCYLLSALAAFRGHH